MIGFISYGRLKKERKFLSMFFSSKLKKIKMSQHFIIFKKKLSSFNLFHFLVYFFSFALFGLIG